LEDENVQMKVSGEKVLYIAEGKLKGGF